MRPLPVAQTGQSTAVDSQTTLPTPFLTKTYQLVDDPSVDDLISWNEDGSSFIVWKPPEFARDLSPKYFKHNNFSSFVRQLNTYGFRKVVPDRWEFANDLFRRGERRLLRCLQRRKVSQTAATSAAAAATVAAPVVTVEAPLRLTTSQVLSNSSYTAGAATASPAARCSTLEFLEENERLRKENVQLVHELNQLRGLCNNILSLMSNYAAGQRDVVGTREGIPEGRSLEFSPVNRLPPDAYFGGCSRHSNVRIEVKAEKETSARLFGVSIGAKRVRGEDDEEILERLGKDEVQTQSDRQTFGG
ncbi:hypothetical protein Nepgr_031578 [Nepenthes gracilis]|uniref:HSF-type DNA-binding domain-containing protein n=1 Tax=Nepenthes gracilis TaxID=150966 RepID=A0AAD3TGZ8_NEPGR|nr:hypothetical protein Nepgr_031578 [Nepenthes gracilis]